MVADEPLFAIASLSAIKQHSCRAGNFAIIGRLIAAAMTRRESVAVHADIFHRAAAAARSPVAAAGAACRAITYIFRSPRRECSSRDASYYDDGST